MKLEKKQVKTQQFSEKVDEHLDSLMCCVWTKSGVKKRGVKQGGKLLQMDTSVRGL